MLLPEIGVEGQSRLARAHALIVGVGALGCTSADWLCRAGVGRITLVDRDVVEFTNLHRQCLYTESDARAGIPKAEAARRRLAEVNSGVRIGAVVCDVNSATLPRLGAIVSGFFSGVSGQNEGVCAPLVSGEMTSETMDFDVIVDGTDNYETRYLLNDFAVREGIPYCYAGVVGVSGAAATVLPERWATPRAQTPTPCIRCLFPDPPAPGSMPTCDTAGVLGPMVGLVASWQSVEVIKILSGAYGRVHRALARFEAWTGGVALVDTSGARDPGCVCCGRGKYEFLDRPAGDGVATLCGRNAVQVLPRESGGVMDLGALGERLRGVGAVERTAFLVRVRLEGERADVGDGVVLTVFPDARAIVSGVTNPDRARALYARMVGV